MNNKVFMGRIGVDGGTIVIFEPPAHSDAYMDMTDSLIKGNEKFINDRDDGVMFKTEGGGEFAVWGELDNEGDLCRVIIDLVDDEDDN